MMRSTSVTALIIAFQQAVLALPATVKTRDISQDVMNQLAFYEQYAAASYCMADNTGAPGSAITCSAGNCPDVQNAGAQSVLEFLNQGPADATGFVGVDNTNQLIVVSFRGSLSVKNWVENFNFGQTPWLCDGCQVHEGFLESWTTTSSEVTNAVSSALSSNPGYGIVVTGHSLGAAIATLAAADLRNQGYTVALYNYGSPMVGNEAFVDFVTNQPGGNYRVTHLDDAVPKLPGYEIDGYRHISPEYWITSDDLVTVTPDVIQVSSGALNLLGNAGTIPFSIADHLWYFNAIALCAPFEIEI